MNPPFSVIFLTTFIGVGQGLFIALFAGEVYSLGESIPTQGNEFYATGSLYALIFLIAGLVASFFHLGHPERAWRAATQWRTSWLSREVIALPVFMFTVFLYGLLHYIDYNPLLFGGAALPSFHLTIATGIAGVIACLGLFICTGMIYACLKFLQEWHTPLTLINYTLLGMASGFTFITWYAQQADSDLLNYYSSWAIILTLTAMFTRLTSLLRNYRIKYKSNLQTAIGVRHTQIQQKAQGAMGGSFNTREFFHHTLPHIVRAIKWFFLICTFVLPVILVSIGINNPHDSSVFIFAFIIQYAGLIAERWFFFAQARHPQNLYYQTI